MRDKKILVLAGTLDGRLLSNELLNAGYAVITSFAGVTSEPILPRGEVRHGGFGGVAGLTSYLQQQNITHIIDATHPFAAQMSFHAWQAAANFGLPMLRLQRPEWQPQQGDRWLGASNMQDAVALIARDARVLITTGRKNLETLFQRHDLKGVIRAIEPLEGDVPLGWHMVLDRPPYSVEEEIALLRKHHITHVLSKNAGGQQTVAKLNAARQLGLDVVMIKRLQKPDCATVENHSDAILWVKTIGLESVAGQDSLLNQINR
jgi:precorrin-6A/cobalt-precorrin-6A reductase